MTELNLRKARKLEAKINAFIQTKKGELSTTCLIRVNENESAIGDVALAARNKFFDELNIVNNLLTTRQDIRNAIADANFNVGIDLLIAQKVLLEAKVGLLNDYTKIDVFDVLGTKDSMLLNRKQQESERTSVYARTVLNANALSQIDKDKIIADRTKAQREIEEKEDKLAELNYSTKITLDAAVIKLLQDNNLI